MESRRHLYSMHAWASKAQAKLQNFLTCEAYERQSLPSIMGLSPGPGLTVKGQCLMSAWMLASLNLRPISLLASNTVFMGFMATCSRTQ